MANEKYIYESPDGGKTVYSRKIGETDMSKRRLVARKASFGVDNDTGIKVSSTVTVDDIDANEMIGTVPVLSSTEDIGWNNSSYAFAPDYADTNPGEFIDGPTINNINKSIEEIKKRLAILEPNLELHEKFQGLKQLYNEYKSMEKLLSGPDKTEEE